MLFIIGAVIFGLADGLVQRVAASLWRADNALTRAVGVAASQLRFKDALIRENAMLKEKL